MAPAVIKLCAILMIVGAVVSDLVQNPPLVTKACMACMCHAVSGCRPTRQCEGDICGLFHIMWSYWADAGKFTLPGMSRNHPDAYTSCALDAHCAAQTVQGYMRRFAKDCNDDGRVDCYDYIRIHMNGGNGCEARLSSELETDFMQCMNPA